MLSAVLVLLGAAAVAHAAIDADAVTSLPGWNKALPSKHYSGHLPVGHPTTGFLHYWFIECETNPSTAPVAVWLNGGPGSSSLIGLLTENGQFQTNDDSIDASGNIDLIYNPYSWSQVANMLYIEQPKGVGFSYCVDGNACNNNDTSVGEETADFLEAFFKGYPEFASNDFYITGESYAGIYIPEIMKVLDTRGSVNLKGALIGDGCWGNEVGTCGFAAQSERIDVEFFQGHGMYPQTLYTQIKAACGNFSAPSLKCKELTGKMDQIIGNFDVYNIYDDCGTDQVYSPATIRQRLRSMRNFTTRGFQSFALHPQLQSGVGGALNDYVCGAMKVMGQWLSQSSVQSALHVSKQGNQNYFRTAADLRPLYKELAQKYKLVIYSGSVDACVPYWGTEEWTRELGFPIKEDWRPWLAGSRDEPKQTGMTAGYVTTYKAGDMDFTFLTVSGAGHLVPQHKPVQALAMLDRALNGKPF